MYLYLSRYFAQTVAALNPMTFRGQFIVILSRDVSTLVDMADGGYGVGKCTGVRLCLSNCDLKAAIAAQLQRVSS